VKCINEIDIPCERPWGGREVTIIREANEELSHLWTRRRESENEGLSKFNVMRSAAHAQVHCILNKSQTTLRFAAERPGRNLRGRNVYNDRASAAGAPPRHP
jgi:hypothetical protein